MIPGGRFMRVKQMVDRYGPIWTVGYNMWRIVRGIWNPTSAADQSVPFQALAMRPLDQRQHRLADRLADRRRVVRRGLAGVTKANRFQLLAQSS